MKIVEDEWMVWSDIDIEANAREVKKARWIVEKETLFTSSLPPPHLIALYCICRIRWKPRSDEREVSVI
jgi:hypothetical protein